MQPLVSACGSGSRVSWVGGVTAGGSCPSLSTTGAAPSDCQVVMHRYIGIALNASDWDVSQYTAHCEWGYGYMWI